VRDAEQGFGGIDVLVANAGGSPTKPQPVEEMRDEDFVEAVELNLVATYRLVVAVLPGMNGTRPWGDRHHVVCRGATADAVLADRVRRRREGGRRAVHEGRRPPGRAARVRANCVAPETIITERTDVEISKDVKEQLVGQHPIRRLGTPTDVAEAVLYLASDRSAWITGVVLDIAGGAVISQ
jgi:3-oxoacyl-[acyl-carrier protein] reductase